MILPDVNVLVYAYREEAPHHEAVRDWLNGVVTSGVGYGMAEIVLSGFVRVVTSPRIFTKAAPIELALAFTRSLLESEQCEQVRPGIGHWSIFTRLCRETNAQGNLVADAYLAALAIERGCEWITFDRDFARFKGLRWRSPFQ